MSTQGIDTVFISTHNWGATAKFLTDLGYAIDFDTGHGSGQLTAATGPTLFVAEVPPEAPVAITPVLRVHHENDFRPAPGGGATDFADTHYGTREATVHDPDGRTWIIQAPGTA
ncbi:hypothetical protein [Tsukamurella sp. 1534]|uniref:hypothetical protein n=1 Tax=Tsukamurella sp. 1534 TaxID=1151061 RepID=UPI000310CB92|nr:hypothetical protein [Tsukamurella sp. 1534]